MRILTLISLILFSSLAFSQEGDSSFDEEYVDGLYPEEEEATPQRAQVQNQNPVQVECVCPQNEVQAEEAESESRPSIFAPGTVFNVSPEVPAAPEKEKQEDVMPGQVKDLPPDYSNDTYYPAGVMPVKKEEE